MTCMIQGFNRNSNNKEVRYGPTGTMTTEHGSVC